MVSQVVIQRNGKVLVTPGENRPEVAAAVRSWAQLEAVIAGSYLFRLSPVAIWGSAARGLSVDEMLTQLNENTATPIPAHLSARIVDLYGRYGAIWTRRLADGQVGIGARDPGVLVELGIAPDAVIEAAALPEFKRMLASQYWPIVDRSVPRRADEVAVGLRPEVELRPYQHEAIAAHGRADNGLVLLPCGAGKTMVGCGVLCANQSRTLILAPSRDIASQWHRALLATTTVNPTDIDLLPGQEAERPITITTYQSASRGRVGTSLSGQGFGLVIYDEVQSLPARVFRTVAAFASERRLGLSATLVREDGRESEIFAMVGPVIYDVPWIELERAGWIAAARCYEVRIPEAASDSDRSRYKHAVVERILDAQRDRPALIVGSNVRALTALATRFGIPLLTGKDDSMRRNEMFEAFRRGSISRLAVSRIGSTGLDLPTAEVMVQVDGNFGSRQEEAQRLGRLLRPGNGQAVDFYSLVSLGTREPEYASRRQRFLIDQGYEYQIVDAAELPRVGPREW